jgi:hypothetical protein
LHIFEVDHLEESSVSNVGPEGRSYLPVEQADLQRLLELATTDMAQFFSHYPNWAKYYADRVLGVALCQGAALHHCFGEVGINDFDVYTFFAAHPLSRQGSQKTTFRTDSRIPKKRKNK